MAAATAALCFRTVEVSAEYDRYHEIAERLLDRSVAFDRFHPFGYPLLIAALSALFGSTLVTGWVVSSIAGGVLVWSASRIAERLRPGTGLAAAVLVAANGLVWIYADMASSDMTAAAAVLVGMAVLLSAPARPTRRRLLAVGIALGFATSVRFTCALSFVLVAAWIMGTIGWRAACVTAAGAAIGYLPQAVPATLLAGSPLHNENWHNVYLKVVCRFDYECLQHAYDSGTMPTLSVFVWDHLGDILRLGVRDSWLACTEMLPAMVLGATDSAAALWLWPLLLAVFGLVWCSNRRSYGMFVLLVAAMQVIVTCFVFEPRPRVLFAAVPFACIGVALLCDTLPRPLWRRAALWLWVAMSCSFGVLSYQRFLARQPTAEVERVRRLPELVHRPMSMLTTLPVADRYVTARALGYMAKGMPTPQATWLGVRERMIGSGVDLFVTGRVSNGQVFEHLTTSEVPADFTVLFRDDDVLILERVPAASPWIESFTVQPATPTVGDELVLTLRLSAEAVPEEVAGTGLTVWDALGEQSLFDLPRTGDGTFERRFVVPTVPGEWRLTPFVLRGNGQVLRGDEVVMQVAR